MGKQEKRAYLEAIRGHYRKADRASKTRILDEFCAVCGFHRKYAIRLLGCKKSAAPLFENPKLVALMNDLYANEWSQLQNHFCPTLKL